MKIFYLSLLMAAALATACNSTNSKVESHKDSSAQPKKEQNALDKMAAAYNQEEHKQIEEYAKKHNLKGEFTETGLYIAIENEGAGEGHPGPQNVITANYRGYLLDGTEFDKSEKGKPLVYPLYKLVPGWIEGFSKLKKGGTAKLILPSALGYGPNAMGPIPPNAVLAFDVNLIDWK